jgi:hypothetical protein
MKSVQIAATLIFAIILGGCRYDKIPVNSDAGFVRGDVFDAMTGPTNTAYIPIDNAVVETAPPTQKANTTNEGSFYIDNVPPGDYILSASKKGFYTNWKGAEVFSGKVTTAVIYLRPEYAGNNPPNEPHSPAPGNGLKVIGPSINLTWEADDPDGDLIFYDVYFGKTNPPLKIISGDIFNRTIKVDSLEKSTTYYWKICVKDWYGASAMGQVWELNIR